MVAPQLLVVAVVVAERSTSKDAPTPQTQTLHPKPHTLNLVVEQVTFEFLRFTYSHHNAAPK